MIKKFLLLTVFSGVMAFGLNSCSSNNHEKHVDANHAREEAREAFDEEKLEEEARHLREEIENN